MSPVHDVAIVSAALLIGLCSCERSVEISAAFNAESQRLQRRTALVGGRLVERGAPGRQLQTVRQEWTIASPLTWSQYAVEVASALEPSYQCTLASPQTQRCLHSRPGDTFQLELVPEPKFSELIVRVRFEARPD